MNQSDSPRSTILPPRPEGQPLGDFLKFERGASDTAIKNRIRRATGTKKKKLHSSEMADFLIRGFVKEVLDLFESCSETQQDNCITDEYFEYAVREAYLRAGAEIRVRLLRLMPEIDFEDMEDVSA